MTDAARQIAGAWLRVTSVCRAGMFVQPTERHRNANRADNLRAIDEAHTLGAECLVLVCGGPGAGTWPGRAPRSSTVLPV